MKLITTILFSFSFLVGCSNTDETFSSKSENTHSIWIDRNIAEITLEPANTKQIKEVVTDIHLINKIIEVINQASDIQDEEDKGKYLGEIHIKDFGSVRLYYSQNREFVYLVSDKGDKKVSIDHLLEAMNKKDKIKAEPIPPGKKPSLEELIPIPPAKGVDEDNVKQLES